MSVVGRFAQGIAAIRPQLHPEHEWVLAEGLTVAQREAFTRLSTYDQRHLCAVYVALRSAGERDADLLKAALLHDIGKVALDGRVRFFDRVMFVLIGAVSSKLLEILTRLPARGWRRGIALARHHPRLGSVWAAQLGCSSRTCWLIEHHADDPPPNDRALHRLIAADHRA